jgi:hypothetical protein
MSMSLSAGFGSLALAALLSTSAAAQSGAIVLRCGSQIHAAESRGFVLFPQDEIFCPFVADPKQTRSFLGLQRGEFGTLDDPDVEDTTIGAIGLGDSFGLLRWGGSRPGDGVHLALAGAVFAQFDLDAPSSDLINADYIVALPLTWRRGWLSTRFRLYHQSSHLGDEYVLRSDQIQRENLSFESFEALVSVEAGPIRLYAGAEHLFRREPNSLEQKLAHGGLELRTNAARVLSLVAGTDIKSSEQYDWELALSARAGLQIAPRARAGHPLRRVLLLAEYYEGPSPYGQFFIDDIRYAGFGVHLLH